MRRAGVLADARSGASRSAGTGPTGPRCCNRLTAATSIVDQFTGGFRVELDQRTGEPVNVIQVVVGPTGFVGAPEQAIVDFIRSTFADRPKPDLIVTVAGPAAVFARQYRQQLFPDTPLLFAAVDERYLQDAPLGENETAVAVTNDFPELVDEILQLLPETRQVVMVMGSGSIGRFWRQELEGPFRRFDDRLTFVWSDELSFPELLLRVASLPDDSAIFYITFGTDAAGAAYADERVMAELHAAANAPLFAGHSVFLGAGVVGGRLMSIDDLSRRTADAAIGILNGAPPRRSEVLRRSSSQPIFDWRELQRWGIPESRLPPGSVVRYRGPNLWGEYRGTVLLAAGALAAQAFLIIWLLFERRARQRAEVDSRRNLRACRRRQSPRDDVRPDDLDWTRAHATAQFDDAQRSSAADDGDGQCCDAGRDQRDPVRYSDRWPPRRADHRAPSSNAPQSSATRAPDRSSGVVTETLALVAHDMRARQIETDRRSAVRLLASSAAIRCCCSRCS